MPTLKRQVQTYRRANAALVESNIRLVASIARRTIKLYRTEVDFHDACLQGIIGITRAVEKFDPSKDFYFSTYAVWWIRGEIQKLVSDKSSPIRLPDHVRKKINDVWIIYVVFYGRILYIPVLPVPPSGTMLPFATRKRKSNKSNSKGMCLYQSCIWSTYVFLT